ncbi:MAG: hypothetical protein GVY20_02745, partial [Bacteroidetes bacterium]|nr:hypothetical protein [Bacteroidota bacterium]
MVFFLFCNYYLVGQADPPPHSYKCYYNEDSISQGSPESSGNKWSENGRLFTPKGDLKTLVVFVSFKGHETEQLGTVWPEEVGGLPNIISNPTSSNYNFHFEDKGYFFKEPSDFSDPTYMNDQSYKGISKMLYQLSKPNESFRFMVETFTDAHGIPMVVDIDPNDYSGGQWRGLNRLAIDRMEEINAGFDMSIFDNRQNYPNFTFDNSSTSSDGVVDNIVFIYRYNGNSDVSEDLPGINSWTGSGGGFYGGSGLGGLSFNGVDMPTRGFTLCVGTGDTRALFLHELGHAVFNAPHIGGANSVSGNYFSLPSTGIGSTANRIPMMNPILNSWERWFLGYITP